MNWLRRKFVNLEIDHQHDQLVRLFILAMAAVVIGFPRLWIAEREVPLTPVFEFLQDPPAMVHKILATLFVLSAFALALVPKNPLLLISGFVFWLSAISFDLLRLQPFFYYSWICLFVIFFDKKRDSEGDFAVNTLRAISFGMYFWPGLTKFNYGFFEGMLPWLVEPFVVLDTPTKKMIAGTIAASGELISAFLLFVPRLRRPGVILVLMIHLGILIIYGPLGRSHHMAILPWNVVQMVLIWKLFWAENFEAKTTILPKSLVGGLARFLVLLLPIASFWNLWPPLFSFRLYSASALHSNLIVEEHFIAKLNPSVRKIWNHENGGLSILAWTLNDTGSFYVAEYYYKNLYWQLCRKMPEENIKLVLNYSLKADPIFRVNKDIDKIFTCDKFKSRGVFYE